MIWVVLLPLPLHQRCLRRTSYLDLAPSLLTRFISRNLFQYSRKPRQQSVGSSESDTSQSREAWVVAYEVVADTILDTFFDLLKSESLRVLDPWRFEVRIALLTLPVHSRRKINRRCSYSYAPIQSSSQFLPAWHGSRPFNAGLEASIELNIDIVAGIPRSLLALALALIKNCIELAFALSGQWQWTDRAIRPMIQIHHLDLDSYVYDYMYMYGNVMVRARLILILLELECNGNGWVFISTLLFAICFCLGKQLPSMVAHSGSAISSRRALLCLRFRWNWNDPDPDPAATQTQLQLLALLRCTGTVCHYLYLLLDHITVTAHMSTICYACIVLYPSSMGTFQSCFSMTKPPSLYLSLVPYLTINNILYISYCEALPSNPR